MSYRYAVIGMIMMLAAAQVLATANVQGLRLQNGVRFTYPLFGSEPDPVPKSRL